MTRERRFALEARAASVVGGVVRRLPRRVALALGRGLGRVWADLDPRHVAIATDNLRHAFPHWDEARLLQTARGVYAHFGQVIFDILWLQHRTRDEVMALVDVEGDGEMRAALAEGRGAIMATGHVGNWELSGVAFGWVFGPSGVVARPLDNPFLDERLVAFRQKSGNAVIYKRQALSQTLRMVRNGQAVAFVVDQNVQADEGIFVDFFGRPAASTTAAAALAVRVGCPIFMGWAELRKSGRYTLHLWVLRSETEGERQVEVERLTQEFAYRIEGWVRSAPEQWLWLHRRWKTRPEKQQSAVSTQQSGTERATEPGTEPERQQSAVSTQQSGTEPGTEPERQRPTASAQQAPTRSTAEPAPATEPPPSQRGPQGS